MRVTVRDGRKVVYNDGIGESSHEALRWKDTWLAERVAIPSLYDGLIETSARQHAIDARLVKSVMLVESAFNPAAVSPKGARGLMQLMPATAAAYGVRDIHDPADNIAGGTRYLSYLLGLFGGNLEKSLAAYNAGETAVGRYGGVPPYRETRLYVRKALTAYYGKTPLGGGFGIAPSENWVGQSALRCDPTIAPKLGGGPCGPPVPLRGKPVRLVRDAQNRVILTTSSRPRSERTAAALRPRLGLRRS